MCNTEIEKIKRRTAEALIELKAEGRLLDKMDDFILGKKEAKTQFEVVELESSYKGIVETAICRYDSIFDALDAVSRCSGERLFVREVA